MRTLFLVFFTATLSVWGYSQDNTPQLSEKGTINKEVESIQKSNAQIDDAVKSNSNPKKKRRNKKESDQPNVREKERIELTPIEKED